MVASAIVTAGFRCAPLIRPTAYTAIATATPQPVVITIHPDFSPLVPRQDHIGDNPIAEHDQHHRPDGFRQKRLHPHLRRVNARTGCYHSAGRYGGSALGARCSACSALGGREGNLAGSWKLEAGSWKLEAGKLPLACSPAISKETGPSGSIGEGPSGPAIMRSDSRLMAPAKAQAIPPGCNQLQAYGTGLYTA